MSMMFKGLKWWRSERAWGMFVFCFFLILQSNSVFFEKWERSFHDLAHAWSSHQQPASTGLIAVDEKSIAQLGPLPWPRQIYAKLIETLEQAHPKSIILSLPNVDPQIEQRLLQAEKLKSLLPVDAPQEAASSDVAPVDRGAQAALTELADEVLQSAKEDARWEQSLQAADIVLVHGGPREGRSDSKNQYPLNESKDDKPAVAADSFVDVLSGKLPAAKYANQVVVIGAADVVLTRSGRADWLPLPATSRFATEILYPATKVEPTWMTWAVVSVTSLVGLWIGFGVTGLSTGIATALCLLFGATFLVLEVCLIGALDIWLKLVFPTLLLESSFAAVLSHRTAVRWLTPVAPAETPQSSDRMMGLALQGQGQLDMAYQCFKRIPMSDNVADDLYCLAMDYERQHQREQAKRVFEHIAKYNINFKDVKEHLSTSRKSPESTQNTNPNSEFVPEQPKVLGRYQIERPLGKGTMGVVYLGKDPKIGRQIALKTMTLSQEFDGVELKDARDRFFSEAKAAGRLQHPGIVTIFDVGEEGDLAFIAMEYVTGQDLRLFCKPSQLMPVPQVVSIVERIARALDYAHRQQVIHRDIKPGNVMYDPLTDTLKVTDFGIARITDGNKTRTGLVLGSPSYMAPEQLAGLKLDGRSDLYASGVMLFQLLTGVLPFRANSLAELMSKIANQPAPDVRQHRPDLPEELANIVARLLEKVPKKRYQDGGALATDLASCAERVQLHVASANQPTPSRGGADEIPPVHLE